MTAFYMTMGIYDLVLVIDVPNDDTIARIAVSLGKGGNVRTVTLKAFDENQYREIIGSVGWTSRWADFLALAVAQGEADRWRSLVLSNGNVSRSLLGAASGATAIVTFIEPNAEE